MSTQISAQTRKNWETASSDTRIPAENIWWQMAEKAFAGSSKSPLSSFLQ